MEKQLLKLERTLAGLSSDAIEKFSRQNRIADEELVRLLDTKRRGLGDEVALLLVQRGRPEPVLHALLAGGLHTALGRVRGTWVLLQFGNRNEGVATAYLALLNDRSTDVLSNVLFGLVFMRNAEAVEPIRIARQAAVGKRRELLERALEALEKGDPKLYSPFFADSANVWGLKQA